MAAGPVHGRRRHRVPAGTGRRVGNGDGGRDPVKDAVGIAEAEAVEVGHAFMAGRSEGEGIEQFAPDRLGDGQHQWGPL